MLCCKEHFPAAAPQPSLTFPSVQTPGCASGTYSPSSGLPRMYGCLDPLSKMAVPYRLVSRSYCARWVPVPGCILIVSWRAPRCLVFPFSRWVPVSVDELSGPTARPCAPVRFSGWQLHRARSLGRLSCHQSSLSLWPPRSPPAPSPQFLLHQECPERGCSFFERAEDSLQIRTLLRALPFSGPLSAEVTDRALPTQVFSSQGSHCSLSRAPAPPPSLVASWTRMLCELLGSPFLNGALEAFLWETRARCRFTTSLQVWFGYLSVFTINIAEIIKKKLLPVQ